MCNYSQYSNKLFQELDVFIDALPTKKDALIKVLHHAQGLFGYLPKEVQLHISKRLDISINKVYDVINFYSYFTTKQKGKYKISVCLGSVCFTKGADKILAEFENILGIKSGKTTSDLKFSLEGLRCVGACGLAPVVVVNEKVYGKVKVDQVKDIINECK